MNLPVHFVALERVDNLLVHAVFTDILIIQILHLALFFIVQPLQDFSGGPVELYSRVLDVYPGNRLDFLADAFLASGLVLFTVLVDGDVYVALLDLAEEEHRKLVHFDFYFLALVQLDIYPHLFSNFSNGAFCGSFTLVYFSLGKPEEESGLM
jgi:hypothetical protein